MDACAYEFRCPRPDTSKPPEAEVMNHPVWVLGSGHLLSVFLTAPPSLEDLLFMVFAGCSLPSTRSLPSLQLHD